MSRRGRSPLEEAGPSRRDFWGVHEELDPHRKRPGLGAGSFGVSRKRPGPAGREICGVQEAAGAWPGMIEPWRAQFSTEPRPGNPGREGLRGGLCVTPKWESRLLFWAEKRKEPLPPKCPPAAENCPAPAASAALPPRFLWGRFRSHQRCWDHRPRPVLLGTVTPSHPRDPAPSPHSPPDNLCKAFWVENPP